MRSRPESTGRCTEPWQDCLSAQSKSRVETTLGAQQACLACLGMQLWCIFTMRTLSISWLCSTAFPISLPGESGGRKLLQSQHLTHVLRERPG